MKKIIITLTLSVLSFSCSTSEDVILLSSNYPEGSVFCSSGATTIVDVISPITGKIWMDRNLGASQVAASSTDANSYGDLYQWGRGNDGHQCRTSSTTVTRSSTDQPANGSFITFDSGNSADWRNPPNNNLWQGTNGVNNPCPSGYRLPTRFEFNEERTYWDSNNAAGAFASPLKLPLAGYRNRSDGSLINSSVGIRGYYWTSTIDNNFSTTLFLTTFGANTNTGSRAMGYSVRCIKD